MVDVGLDWLACFAQMVVGDERDRRGPVAGCVGNLSSPVLAAFAVRADSFSEPRAELEKQTETDENKNNFKNKNHDTNETKTYRGNERVDRLLDGARS